MLQGKNQDFRRWIADRAALPMFCLSVLFLAVVAAVLVLVIEAPSQGTPRHGDGELPLSTDGDSDPRHAFATVTEAASSRAVAVRVLLWILVAIWPLFVLEAILRITFRDRDSSSSRSEYALLLAVLCPPLRLCMRHADREGNVWLPGFGWQAVNEDLRQRLERDLSVPMLIIALMILPVLLVEFAMVDQVASRVWLQVVLGVSTGLIWFAFAAEFIVMVTMADKKLRYCKQHWLDLAIILLPLISFLRSLRVVRQSGPLAWRVQQLTRMGRVYRLRGLAMRAFRGVLLLELVNRVLRVKPERRIRALRELLEEKEREVVRLRGEIAAMEALIASRQQAASPAPAVHSEAADNQRAGILKQRKARPSSETALECHVCNRRGESRRSRFQRTRDGARRTVALVRSAC